MSPPFANGTEGDLFLAHRCERCAYWNIEFQHPCSDFDPAYFGEWPEIFFRSDTNILGVECSRYLPVGAR